MIKLFLFALSFTAALVIAAGPVPAQNRDGAVSVPEDGSGPAYLIAYNSPHPIRHVITMSSMRDCMRAAEFSNALCVNSLPRFPNPSTGHFRSLKKSSAVSVSTQDYDGVGAKLGDAVSVPGDGSGPAYLIAYNSPHPIRHVITMPGMRDCLLAAEYSNALCVNSLPRFPDPSTGHFRSLKKSSAVSVSTLDYENLGAKLGDAVSVTEDGSGPAYLIAYNSPHSIRHVITMSSMKDCLEAAEFSNARCVNSLPRFPDPSTGHLRSLERPLLPQ